jgi:hypothetical protein
MLTPELLQAKWPVALDYPAYLATGTPEQQRRWNAFFDASAPSAEQTRLVSSFTRPIRVLVVSGVWCGDCVEQVPFLRHFELANPKSIQLRLLDRDLHKDLSSNLRICGGDRVPVALFLSEDLDFLALAGDRSLSRYRAKAKRDLGDTCSTGLFIPPAEQVAANRQDWLDELERTQLMLRLSPRYRQKYGD